MRDRPGRAARPQVRWVLMKTPTIMPMRSRLESPALMNGSDMPLVGKMPVTTPRVKIDAVPGRLNETWFKANRIGAFADWFPLNCGFRMVGGLTVNTIKTKLMLLTGQRTGMVRDQSRLLYVAPDMKSRIAWRIAPGAVVNITLCEDIWCRVSKDGKSGYILRNQLWGTYQREAISG